MSKRPRRKTPRRRTPRLRTREKFCLSFSGGDAAIRNKITSIAKELGATVSAEFSDKVTHVISFGGRTLKVLAASVSQKHVVWGEDWIMKCRRSGKWLPVGLHGFKHTTNLFDKQTVVVLPSFRASAPMPRMKILGTLIQRFGLGKMVDLSSGGARKRSKAVSANFVLVGDGLGHPGEILKDYKISVDKDTRYFDWNAMCHQLLGKIPTRR